ncbi:MAG: nucleotide sugar dehydrogenase [Candidatus Acetothermia bacterium]
MLEKIESREAVVAVIGLGYVGLPLAVAKAKGGFEVIGIERKRERVDMVNNAENYISDVPEEDLEAAVDAGNLQATQDFSVVEKADVVTICVPTPLDEAKNPVTKYIENVVEKSLPYAHEGQLFILESTTYPGTTQEVIQPRLEEAGFSVGEDVYLAFSPERVDPGNENYRTGNTPKVVGGVTQDCTEIAQALYREVIDGGIHAVSSPAVAELEKLFENVFRIVNISLVNELAMLADRMGIDIWEVIEAAKTKPFGFMPFYPGPGLGGHCIPLDPFYLSWKAKQTGFSTRFIELAGQINDQMPGYVTERAMELLNTKGIALKGADVLMVGVAYKEGIEDTRESPALEIGEKLVQRGADLSYHDPYVREVNIGNERFSSVELSDELLDRADLVLITTAHSDVDYGMIVDTADLIYDTRNALGDYEGDNIYKLGNNSVKG